MGCDPTIPHTMSDVKFAGGGIDAEKVSGETDLIHKFVATQMHALFVERHKANTIDGLLL